MPGGGGSPQKGRYRDLLFHRASAFHFLESRAERVLETKANSRGKAGGVGKVLWEPLAELKRGAGGPIAKLSPPGSREHPMGYKSALEGQESKMGTAVTLALETDFPRAVLSQKLHSAGPSPENSLQYVFPFIVNPEPNGSSCERPKMFWRKKNKGRKWRQPDGLGSPSRAGPSLPVQHFGDGHPGRRRLAPEPASSGGNG
ncbi:hypothetical protein Celaphus_00012098 [Cervus elaphus hippelaphus]|uniref:Uncharacterized protein n=1 Tax=Cervus elaphus hippelaphus TaxID=46360 RepID=A0A212CLC4_CEREH|nr:hypothetical protein Celaphus_00012098 [Cervus elaphus hippelaphus]